MKFYICRRCGNIVTMLTSSKVPLHCCGQPMELLEAGVTDAAVEKHVPVVTVEGNLVKVAVGSVAHPMVEEHFIQWVAVETERDALVHWFHPGEAPEALRDLPAPDRVFLGGSSGNMEAILRCALEKNPAVRIVVNAVTLETTAEILRCFAALDLTDTDMVQVAATRTRKAGRYHLMDAQNPVWIVSGEARHG